MNHPHRQHVITITPQQGRVVVHLAGEVVADSTAALCLNEAGYAPVLYLPRSDVSAAALRPAARVSHCPFKGEASYWTLRVGEKESVEAAWCYEQPFAAVATIAGHLAFYADRVESIDVC